MFSFSKINLSYKSTYFSIISLVAGSSYCDYSNNFEFSWISEEFSVSSNSDTLYLFCYIWLSIVFFLIYLNVGLATLLFLLEAGLFSPIATMALINSLPMSSILFFINAITMESVVGVIVVLTYSRDWAVRDFTKYEVLESNLYLKKKNSGLRKHSWSNLVNLWLLYNLNLIFKFFIVLTILSFFITIFNGYWKYGSFSFQNLALSGSGFNFFNKLNYFGVNFRSNVNENFDFIELPSIKKNPTLSKLSEFINQEYSAYSDYNSSLLRWHYVSKGVKNLDYFWITNTTSIEPLDWRFWTKNEKFPKFNPKNEMLNILAISGLFSDSTFTQRNNTLTPQKKFKLGGGSVGADKNSSFYGTKIYQNSNIIETLEYEKKCQDLIVLLEKNKTKTKNILYKKKNKFILQDFSIFSELVKNRGGLLRSTSSLSNLIENFYNLGGFSNPGMGKYSYIKKIKNQEDPDYVIKIKGLGSQTKTDFLGGLTNYKYLSFEKFFLFSKNKNTQMNYKFKLMPTIRSVAFLESEFSFLERLSTGLVNYENYGYFIKNSAFRINLAKKRYLKVFSENKIEVYSTTYSVNFKKYTELVKNQIKIIVGEVSWGSKNKGSLLSPRSKNLPWFDQSNDDEFFYDDSAYTNFSVNFDHDDLFSTENNKVSADFFIENIIKTNGIKKNNQKILKTKFKLDNFIFKKKKNKIKIKWLKNRPKYFGNRNHKKSKVWKIALNWSYNQNTEDLYNFQNKNLNLMQMENKLFVKRLGNVNLGGHIEEYRQLSKFGSQGFNNSTISINSNQSQDFGISVFNSFENMDYENPYYKKTNDLYKKIKIKKFSFLEKKNDNFIKKIYKTIDKGGLPKSGFGINVGNSLGTFNYSKKLNNNNKKSSFDTVEDFSKFFDNYQTGSDFYKKLKIFWDLKKNINSNISYYEIKNKDIVNDRFLSTFKKINKNRGLIFKGNLNRFDRFALSNREITKFFQNNLRMVGLSRGFGVGLTGFGSDEYNKIRHEPNRKYMVEEDFEVFEKSTRSGYKKPHTVYGILWDEYLKHTYGFSLNFLDFSKPIKNLGAGSMYQKYPILGSDFYKKIEKSLSVVDKYTGLKTDSQIAGEISGRFLPKIGFFREVDPDVNLNEDWDVIFKKNTKYIKNLKKTNIDYSIRDKKKIKKYFKKSLLQDTISKASIVKKSIPYIKKFSEAPTGLKYDNLEIGINLPYIKKNLQVNNEEIYESHKIPTKKNWVDRKNFSNSITNRLESSKKSKIKLILQDDHYFKKNRQREYLIKLENSYLKNYIDFKNSGLKISKKPRRGGKNFNFFIDKDDIFETKSSTTENTKRNLETTKPTNNKEFTKRFDYINRTSISVFKKNRSRKFKNYSLFFRSNTKKNNIIGGGSLSQYGNQGGVDYYIFLKNIYKNRMPKKYDRYDTFESRSVKGIRSFQNKKYYEIENIKKNNYKNLKISNEYLKSGEFWNVPGLVKNARFDLNFYENTLNKKNYANNQISENFKLRNVNKNEIWGHNREFFFSNGNEGVGNLFKYVGLEKKDNLFSNFYNTKENFNYTYKIKNSKFSGLGDTTLEFFKLDKNLKKSGFFIKGVVEKPAGVFLKNNPRNAYVIYKKKKNLKLPTFLVRLGVLDSHCSKFIYKKKIFPQNTVKRLVIFKNEFFKFNLFFLTLTLSLLFFLNLTKYLLVNKLLKNFFLKLNKFLATRCGLDNYFAKFIYKKNI